MIDHIGIAVTDLDKSVDFYTKALAPLGYKLFAKYDGQAAGFAAGNVPDFWLGVSAQPRHAHVAFRATGRAQVRDFYAAATGAGGTDNGAPGVRPHYHEHYYGAFVLDPDGNNVEAVCHEPFLG